jgi:hypothetical protein
MSCKKEISKLVDQDKIWTYYELFYDENTDKTYASATFRFSSENGTRLMLSDPSTITVDGTEMTWSDDLGYYQNEFPGLKPTAEFHWVDLDGKSFRNIIEVRNIAYPTMLTDTLLHSDSVSYFMWEGAPLEAFESVKLTLDGEGNSDARIWSVDSVAATTITIDSLRLLQVDSGMVLLHLDKLYSPDLQEETSRGGLLIGKYRATDKTIYLE